MWAAAAWAAAALSRCRTGPLSHWAAVAWCAVAWALVAWAAVAWTAVAWATVWPGRSAAQRGTHVLARIPCSGSRVALPPASIHVYNTPYKIHVWM